MPYNYSCRYFPGVLVPGVEIPVKVSTGRKSAHEQQIFAVIISRFTDPTLSSNTFDYHSFE